MIHFDCRVLDSFLVSDCSRSLALLSNSELADLSARDYRHDLRKAQFVHSRLALKRLFSSALNIDSKRIVIDSSLKRAPLVLVDDVALQSCSVSISHDRNLVLVAIAFGFQCGVDIQSWQGIDWSGVVSFMGWSVPFSRSFELLTSAYPSFLISPDIFSAMIWSAYEAWMKMTCCLLPSSKFAWQSFDYLAGPSGMFSSFFEMIVNSEDPDTSARVIIGLSCSEVIAVAYKHVI